VNPPFLPFPLLFILCFFTLLGLYCFYYVEGELEQSIGLLNHVSTVNEFGANDHEAGTSGGNQGEDDPQPMVIEIYQPPKNTRPTYSQFKRMVLNQLQDLNMAQNAHHAYCTRRFQDLDDQLHNVHDLLSNVYNKDNPRNE